MEKRPLSRLSPELLVPFLGLVYVGILFLYLTATLFYLTQTNPAFYAVPIFGVVYLALAALIWRRNRFGYLVSIVVSLLFIFFFTGQVQTALSGFSNIPEFLDGITAVPILILVFVYSIAGARLLWRKSPPTASPRMMPMSSTLALVAVGFIMGASAIGVIAGQDIATLVANSGSGANVTIILGASTTGGGISFSPANYTVKVGGTVVWLNKDTVTHTVTSTAVPGGAATFNSGNLAAGQQFSWTFSQVGVYHYYCSIHPLMTGTITVVNG